MRRFVTCTKNIQDMLLNKLNVPYIKSLLWQIEFKVKVVKLSIFFS